MRYASQGPNGSNGPSQSASEDATPAIQNALSLLAGLLLAACILTTACGSDGGGGSTPELEAYANAFILARAQSNDQLAYLPPLTLDQDETVTDAERDSIRANYAATMQLSRDYRDAVAAITVPPAIAEAHAAYLAALDAQNEYRSQFEEQYGQVQTLAELQAVTAEVLDSEVGREAQATLDEACHTLRDETGGTDSLILCGDEDPTER